MGLFLGRETRAMWPEPPIPPFPGADMAGYVSTSSNPNTALAVPTVWACVSLLAGSVSSLPLETFSKTANPLSVPKRVPDPQLVLTPDEGMTQSEWLHMAMVSMLLRGNVYGLIRRDAMANPVAVHLLNPDAVKVSVDRDTGRVVYKYSDDRPIDSQNMWHVRGLTLPGSLVGLSPISYAAALLGLDLSSRQFASGFFEGGGVPKAILESDQPVNQEQARTIKDRVMATLRGREPLVLGLGLKYNQIQVNPEESQFLATQQANVAQICRFFSVPAAMIDGPSGGGMQYSNTEQRGIEFLTYSLAHWLKRFEDAMFSLLSGNKYVKFNAHQLLRLDAETQAKVDMQRVAMKAVVPSEIRARDGLDPMTPQQLAEAEMVPLTIGPTGAPKPAPPPSSPTATPPAPDPATADPTGA